MLLSLPIGECETFGRDNRRVCSWIGPVTPGCQREGSVCLHSWNAREESASLWTTGQGPERWLLFDGTGITREASRVEHVGCKWSEWTHSCTSYKVSAICTCKNWNAWPLAKTVVHKHEVRCCFACVQLKTGTGILSKLKKQSKRIGHLGFSISYTRSIDGMWKSNHHYPPLSVVAWIALHNQGYQYSAANRLLHL